jgi:hypothetical protein
MSIRDRLFTRDIAHAAAERRDRLRDEERLDEHPRTATIADAPAAVLDETAAERSTAGERPVAVTDPADRAATAADNHTIFPGDEAGGFRSRWEAIQTGFVDEPRAAVEQADALVAQVVTRLAEVFSDERERLENQWDRGDNISTEDLRIALKRYRSFFDRLLSV